MSYQEPSLQCDWCRHRIDSGDEVACATCTKELEDKLGDAEDTIKNLKIDVESLEAELENIKQARIFGHVEP